MNRRYGNSATVAAGLASLNLTSEAELLKSQLDERLGEFRARVATAEGVLQKSGDVLTKARASIDCADQLIAAMPLLMSATEAVGKLIALADEAGRRPPPWFHQ